MGFSRDKSRTRGRAIIACLGNAERIDNQCGQGVSHRITSQSFGCGAEQIESPAPAAVPPIANWSRASIGPQRLAQHGGLRHGGLADQQRTIPEPLVALRKPMNSRTKQYGDDYAKRRATLVADLAGIVAWQTQPEAIRPAMLTLLAIQAVAGK
jgi:hypothetical protein